MNIINNSIIAVSIFFSIFTVEDDAPIVPLEELLEELTINDEPPAMNNEEEDEEMDMEEDQPIEQDEVTIVRSNRFMS